LLLESRQDKNLRAPVTVYALIPAAGAGSRMETALPKQYAEVAGRPLLYHALRPLVQHPQVRQVFVVLAPGDHRFANCDWREFGDRLVPLYCGGPTRVASVFNGLVAAHDAVSAADWMLVHDAARPCLERGDIDRLLAALAEDDAGGLLAVPVADTLKRADAGLRIMRTEERAGLWLAQTPQMFRYRVLLEALQRADPATVTDEAGAVEALGIRPRIVMGNPGNIKVTHPGDLGLVRRMLENRQAGAVGATEEAS
jgi:2-C-methyl-D-erythritol 4-phosphate cytidylyltransferase